MKKTSLLLVLGLAVILASAAAPKAHARVVVEVGIGVPVYGYPVPAYGYVAPPYVAPAYVGPGYFAPYVAVAPGPYYRRAYVGRVYRDGWRYRRHERWEGWRFDGRRAYNDYR